MTEHHDHRNRQLSEAVIQAIAEETGSDPTEFRPLGEVIDPDALDALFLDTSGSVSFRYEGMEVTVRSNGTVTATTDS